MTTFTDYVALADDLVNSAASTRKTIHEAMEGMYFMKSEDPRVTQGGWIKETLAPDMHVAVKGAARMLTATEPRFKVPEYGSDETSNAQVTTVVDWATRTWRNAGVIRGGPIQLDASLSALLYGEINIATSRSKALVDIAKSPAEKRRAENIQKRTALLPEILNPRICYPLVTNLGLEAHLVQRKMRVIDALRRGGPKAASQLATRSKFEEITFCELWDLENHVVWVQGESDPLILEEHKLSVLPIVYRRVEGSMLWDQYDRNVDSIQPFLYSAWKSGLWERYNLALTTFYSLLFAIGSSGVYKFKASSPDRTLDIDFTHPGSLITILTNEDLSPMGTGLLTPEMIQAITIAEKKLVEATIYRQTLGEPLGGNAPFSMVSMLSQAGRQPLIPYQRMVSHAIGEVLQNGITILREANEKVTWATADGKTVFDPKQLDEEIEITADLDIDLPQDAKQNVQVALSAVSGGILDLETALRDILKVDQPEKIIQAILADKVVNTITTGELARIQAGYQMQIQAQQQQIAQQMQAQAAQQQQVSPQGPGPQQPGGPQGGPTREQLMAAIQNAQAGAQGPSGAIPEAGGIPPGQELPPGAVPGIQSNQAQEGLPLTGPQEQF